MFLDRERQSACVFYSPPLKFLESGSHFVISGGCAPPRGGADRVRPPRAATGGRRMRLASRLGTLAAALLGSALPQGTARSIGIEDVVDGGNTYAWQQIELPGTVCGNGSQYRFYVYDSPTCNTLLIEFEGGGACWDYATCSGQAGILGAAHPNGIPNDYIHEFQPQYVSPPVNRADPGIPGRPKKNIATNGFDMVYVPYCTGDVHIGNAVRTYTDPTRETPPPPSGRTRPRREKPRRSRSATWATTTRSRSRTTCTPASRRSTSS